MDTPVFEISANDWSMLARMALAIGAGAVIGLERRRRLSHPAGLRTMTIIALGACVFTLVSVYGFLGIGGVSDPGRVAAQVVTGVGFLGAGIMIRGRDTVRNLTTAASIWVAAALGVAAGAGLLTLTLAGTAGAFVALRFLPRRPTSEHLEESSEDEV